MKEKVEVLIAQFNSVVGDLEGNTNRIINIIREYRSLNSKKIIIFPELALCGYSPEDLLLRKDFSQAIGNSINTIKDNIENFNKKALYILIREMTGSNTQHITRIINVMKKYNKRLQHEFDKYGMVDEVLNK